MRATVKFLAGFLAGIGTAWAALAIWRQLPEFPDLDADPDWEVGEIWEPRRGDRRPGYDDAAVSPGGWTMPIGEVPFGDFPNQR